MGGKKPRIEEEGTWVDGPGTMANEVPRFVSQARVSHLLSIPEDEVRRISIEAGLGRVERAGSEEVTYFTYEEFHRVGILAARSHGAKH
jgi:hypothetical protein